MNASTVADVLLIAAAVVWVLARQVQVARVKPRQRIRATAASSGSDPPA
jgi:hypothetical protein